MHPIAANAYGLIRQFPAEHFPKDEYAFYDTKDMVFAIIVEGANEWAKLTWWSEQPGPLDHDRKVWMPTRFWQRPDRSEAILPPHRSFLSGLTQSVWLHFFRPTAISVVHSKRREGRVQNFYFRFNRQRGPGNALQMRLQG
ncbi:hypothetical protein [Rhizobium mesoamericanum]|uniref:hypothetical protein n=1 Tax=Rhizobium mesoamericanum TaxID=1079800 RepID=UPI00059457A1|nr:hypothetical protein [Rhizobium mesoamericanum]